MDEGGFYPRLIAGCSTEPTLHLEARAAHDGADASTSANLHEVEVVMAIMEWVTLFIALGLSADLLAESIATGMRAELRSSPSEH
jgi:hypothetical protein